MRSPEDIKMSFHSNFSNLMVANVSVDPDSLSSLSSLTDSEDDLSDTPFSACDSPPELLPTSFLTLFVIVYLVIIAVALLGNLLVILVIWADRKMRTVTNVLLVSLAGSDALIAGLNMPFQLKFLIENEWTMGEGLCKFTNYIQGVVVVTSIFTLTGIAIDRYYAICRPLEARHLHTTGRALLLVGCFWLSALVILIPQLKIQRLEPFLVYNEQLGSLHIVHVCVEYFSDHRLNVAYTCFFYAVLYVLPVAVMVVAYGRIGVTLWHRSPLAEAASSSRIRADAGRRMAEKKRVVKMLVLIVAVFSVSWFPFFTAQVYFLFDGGKCHRRFNFRLLVAVIQVLAYSNSCVNPVIYCLLNDSFKQSIRRALAKAGAKLRLRRLAWGSGRRGTLTDTMRTTMGLFSTSNRRGSLPVNGGAFIRQMSLPLPPPPPLRPELLEETERQKEALAAHRNHQAARGGGGGPPAVDEEDGQEGGRLLGNGNESSSSDVVLLDRCQVSVDRPEEQLITNERNSMKTCHRLSSGDDVDSAKDMDNNMASHSSNRGVIHASDSQMEAAAAAAAGDSPSAIAVSKSCALRPESLLQERNPDYRSSLDSEGSRQIQPGCKGSDGGRHSRVEDGGFNDEHVPTAERLSASEGSPLVNNNGARRMVKAASVAEIQTEFRRLDQLLAQLLKDAGIYD